jgi:uroporphyrinogen decarboxylase
MDDLIDDVGIDVKHSLQDKCLSAPEARLCCGDRIAILGGMDMDMISRSNEEQVRAYDQRLLQECMPDGGYALGTGNLVVNHVPVENYHAMLDEGMNVGRYL